MAVGYDRVWMKLARVLKSLLVGVALAGLQWALIFADYSWPDWLVSEPYRAAATFLAMPGMIIAMAAGGNVHAFSTAVVFAANVIFYALITYGLMSLLNKRRLTVHTPTPM
jgi:hypothetical protein